MSIVFLALWAIGTLAFHFLVGMHWDVAAITAILCIGIGCIPAAAGERR